jgi:hypothetical protein
VSNLTSRRYWRSESATFGSVSRALAMIRPSRGASSASDRAADIAPSLVTPRILACRAPASMITEPTGDAPTVGDTWPYGLSAVARPDVRAVRGREDPLVVR